MERSEAHVLKRKDDKNESSQSYDRDLISWIVPILGPGPDVMQVEGPELTFWKFNDGDETGQVKMSHDLTRIF